MSPALHYEAADLALFSMQLLPPSASREVAAHVASCSFCRQEMARLQGDLAAYANTVEMHAPPPVVRERVLNQVAREKKKPPVEPVERLVSFESNAPLDHLRPAERTDLLEEPELTLATRGQSPRHNRTARETRVTEPPKAPPKSPSGGRIFGNLLLSLGWIAAAGLAFMGNKLYHERESYQSRLSAQSSELERLKNNADGSSILLNTITASTARHVLLSPASSESTDPAPQGRIIYVAENGALIFLGNNLEPLQPSRTYELWLIPANDRDPIPAGTFHPDEKGNASVILPPLPRSTQAKAFGVTIEDEGGSQSPTLPIVLAGS